jgi:hypothetical protein
MENYAPKSDNRLFFYVPQAPPVFSSSDSSSFPVIKSTHSLVAKHVTKEKWDKLCNIKTKTSGFTLAKE